MYLGDIDSRQQRSLRAIADAKVNVDMQLSVYQTVLDILTKLEDFIPTYHANDGQPKIVTRRLCHQIEDLVSQDLHCELDTDFGILTIIWHLPIELKEALINKEVYILRCKVAEDFRRNPRLDYCYVLSAIQTAKDKFQDKIERLSVQYAHAEDLVNDFYKMLRMVADVNDRQIHPILREALFLNINTLTI